MTARLDFDRSSPPDLKLDFFSACGGFPASVTRISIGASNRPGEPNYWIAFVQLPEKRYGLGTPDLRHLPLEEQAPHLCAQLRELRQALNQGDTSQWELPWD